ncbi:MAG: 2-oxo acid dehydrogenase subunit E2 [Oscillospiraceae bacterium]|nr:2-oxo acid dehydrogenase subunit E2 [Oscillospiraceae bacterium]
MAEAIIMPQLGLTMEEGTLIQWLVHEGDAIKAGQELAEISTDKLSSQVVSETDGFLLKIVAAEGEDVPVKGVLAYVGTEEEMAAFARGSDLPPEQPVTPDAEPKAVPQGGRIKSSPLARKTAEKLGVDLFTLHGSGPGGRIVQRDVMQAAAASEARRSPSSPGVSPALPSQKEPAPVVDNSSTLLPGDKLERLSNMRKTVARRMLQSHTEIPSVTITMKVNVTELTEFRKTLLEKTGCKYSVNDLVLKATAKALAQHPEINVAYHEGQVLRRGPVNLGMAVALPDGLIVPVIRDADRKTLSEIYTEARALAAKAKENALTEAEFAGGTLTVTNLGMYGVESFTPIINQPEACILGVAGIESELDLDAEGKLYKKQVMRLCLTMDHRLLDGAAAAKFLADLRDILQCPLSILL